ncbi:MAG TPA: alanine--glyoxylate aminotransferase family protein [Longimicrobiales bacterium]|nr:alanine--glyoxylate aminotransferase family protein [Longimicrobiales bacterium]
MSAPDAPALSGGQPAANVRADDRLGRFFLPGPTEVRPDVLAAQVKPMIGHRGPEMSALMERLQDGLRPLFRTEWPVLVSTSSATGFMEAAVRNGVERRALALVNGAFSERFAAMVRESGLEVETLDVGWGGVHEPSRVAEALARGAFDAVVVVHSETSTGVLNPVADLARVAHDAGAVILVDAVTSLGGSPVEPDAWQLDFTLTGSQKALALPPGLAFGVAQPAMLERARRSTRRGTYFDLLEFEAQLEKKQTPNTPALSLLYALERQLANIAAEGLDARWARHRAMAERTWRWVEELARRGVAVRVLAPEGARAWTVTCVCMPGDEGAAALVRRVAARGWTIAGGYGDLKDRMFRIGHMGDHTVARLEDLLGVIEEELVG